MVGIVLTDVCRLEYDAALDGAQEPDYQTLVDLLPCQIRHVGGSERVHGRQQEGLFNYHVETSYNEDFGKYAHNMRLVVLEGPQPMQVLNVVDHGPVRKVGLDYGYEFMCIELEEVTVTPPPPTP